MLRFEWHGTKAAANLRKHGVSFDEAATVFSDLFSFTYPDPDHSLEEPRFLIIGMAATGRILVVSHTERSERLRLISAREATRKERSYYEKNRKG